MKNIFFPLAMLFAFAILPSCSKMDDPYEGDLRIHDRPELSDATPTDARIKSLYETYNVYFQPEFSQEVYTWDWNNRVPQADPGVTGRRFTPADRAYATEVMDSVESWVFKSFPLDFARRYMPMNILMADTLADVQMLGTAYTYRMWEGNVATNYIIISYVSARFEAQKQKRMLAESWLSLFVEKMLATWPNPAAFAAISKAGYDKTSYTYLEDVMVNYAILKKGRTKQSVALAISPWNRTTMAQDFGDFVAFIVLTPESEKQLAYAKNPNIAKKVEMVKAYFLENFNIELPYRPMNP